MFAGVYGEYDESLFLERVAFTLAGHIGVAFYWLSVDAPVLTGKAARPKGAGLWLRWSRGVERYRGGCLQAIPPIKLRVIDRANNSTMPLLSQCCPGS